MLFLGILRPGAGSGLREAASPYRVLGRPTGYWGFSGGFLGLLPGRQAAALGRDQAEDPKTFPAGFMSCGDTIG